MDGWLNQNAKVVYIEARESGKLVYSAPYHDAMTGQYAVSIAMPLNDANENSLGVVAGDILGISSGDFTQRITVKGKDEFAELSTAFNGMSVQLGSLLGQVSASAGQVQAISSD